MTRGPFIVREMIGLGDVRYWLAIDPQTGVCCPGREEKRLAEQDAQALNEAWEMGFTVREKE